MSPKLTEEPATPATKNWRGLVNLFDGNVSFMDEFAPPFWAVFEYKICYLIEADNVVSNFCNKALFVIMNQKGGVQFADASPLCGGPASPSFLAGYEGVKKD